MTRPADRRQEARVRADPARRHRLARRHARRSSRARASATSACTAIPKTLVAVEYYFKMPRGMHERDAIVLDPMLATGNSAVAAVERLKETRPRSIRFVCLRGVPRGHRARSTHAHPDVPIYTGVDRPRSSTTTATSCRAWATPATASSARSDRARSRRGDAADPQRHAARWPHAASTCWSRDGRIVDVAPRIDAPAARDARRAGLAAVAAVRRRALPHGLDAHATACRASTRAARCSKASRCGAS